MGNFGLFDQCDCKVRVEDVDSGEKTCGVAGFSQSHKTCYVWYDDSSCDKYMAINNGLWKIPTLYGRRFKITQRK